MENAFASLRVNREGGGSVLIQEGHASTEVTPFGVTTREPSAERDAAEDRLEAMEKGAGELERIVEGLVAARDAGPSS